MLIDRAQARLGLVVLALVVLFVAGSWWPQTRQGRELAGRIASAQVQLQSLRLGEEDLPALQRRVTSLRGELQGQARQVPADNDLAKLLYDLCAAMNEQNLTDQQIVTKAVVQQNDYAMLPLQLEFKGRFPQVYQLVQQIEHMPRLVRVRRLEIHADPAHLGEKVGAELELSAVYAPREAAR